MGRNDWILPSVLVSILFYIGLFEVFMLRGAKATLGVAAKGFSGQPLEQRNNAGLKLYV